MQTLSYLRRSRFNLQPLIALLLFCTALVYESMGTVYLYLSPLLGVGFYFWRQYHTQKESYFYITLFFLYTLYFEIDREMILFSFVLLATFYHFFLAQKIETTINCTLCIYVIDIVFAYLGYYLVNLFLAFLFNIDLPAFDSLYFIYMATDLFILVLLT